MKKTRAAVIPATFLDEIDPEEPRQALALVGSLFASLEAHQALAGALADGVIDRTRVKKKQPRLGKGKKQTALTGATAFPDPTMSPLRPPPTLEEVLASSVRLAETPSGLERLAAASRLLGVGTLPPTVPAGRMGWALSGGGAKGSFEAGAIRYLGSRWKDLRPEVVAGTSVGSVNALGVCNWGGQCEDKIPELWLTRLRFNSDMYVQSEKLKELDLALQPAGTSVEKLLKGGFSLPGGQLVPDWGYLIANLVLPGFGTLVLDGIANSLALGVLVDILNKASKLDRVFSLEPTRTMMREVLGTMAPRTKLRLVTVSMLSGKPYYIDEHARALEFQVEQPRGSSQATFHVLGANHTDALIRGAMASATIPVMFGTESMWLSNSDDIQTLAQFADAITVNAKEAFKHVECHQMVDGGIRDVLPLHAAIDAGATSVIAVSASPRGVGRAKVFGLKPFAPTTPIIEQIPRMIDLLVNEVAETDRLELGPPASVVFIDPMQEVHDLLTIDPGLIRINIDYGYMRAFDVCEVMPPDIQASSGLVQFLWAVGVVGTAEDITALRKQVWRLEEKAAMQMPVIEKAVINSIRALKRKINEQTKLRMGLWRQSRCCALTLPGGLVIEDSWREWERHAPVATILLSMMGGPWKQHFVNDNGQILFESLADVGVVPP